MHVKFKATHVWDLAGKIPYFHSFEWSSGVRKARPGFKAFGFKMNKNAIISSHNTTNEKLVSIARYGVSKSCKKLYPCDSLSQICFTNCDGA